MARKKRKTGYRKENIVKILLTVIIVWFVAILVINQVRVGLIQTAEVSAVVLEDVDAGYGLLKGKETVVIAPADGAVERTAAEGSRIRRGNEVFRVGGSIAYTNVSGLVSYKLDGLEGIEDLSTVCATDLPSRYEEQEKAQETQAIDAVSGAAYAKVINNFDGVYLYLVVPRSDYVVSLEAGQAFPVRFVGLDYEAEAVLEEALDAAGGERYLKAKLVDVREIVFQKRVYAVELPYHRTNAIVVPVEAVLERDGVQGVYYLQKGFAFWQPVTVREVREADGIAVIDEGLAQGDLIVTTPGLVHEGENVKF